MKKLMTLVSVVAACAAVSSASAGTAWGVSVGVGGCGIGGAVAFGSPGVAYPPAPMYAPPPVVYAPPTVAYPPPPLVYSAPTVAYPPALIIPPYGASVVMGVPMHRGGYYGRGYHGYRH